MSARKTFSLPDELAYRLEREARRTGRDQSAIVRDSLQRYFTETASSSLDAWLGKGESGRPLDHEDLHAEIAGTLDEKHGAGSKAKPPKR